MQTECIQTEMEFQGLGSRQVSAKFDGGPITSDAGGLLLREVDSRLGLLGRFARGDMENRIEEQQLDLFADRTSTSWLRSNQLRLWFSSVA